MKVIFVALLGLLQGSVIIPLALYLGLLVRRDLSQRFSKLGSIANVIAPLAMMIVWLTMSFFAMDSLLDIITDAAVERSKAGRVWAVCIFMGLVTLAVFSIVASKMKLFKN